MNSAKFIYEMLHIPDPPGAEIAYSSARGRAGYHKMLGVRITMRDAAYRSISF